ncbi:MAG: glycosyltransferase [Anaerolineae bacterium]|nr:glycosyltransferase [Anaerolineae bacterium]
MRILYVTSEWPTETHPWYAPFLVRQVGALRRAGVDIEVFPFRGQRKLKNYVRIYRRLHTKIRNESFDVIHAQFGHSGLLASIPKRSPMVVTFQGSDLQGIYTSRGYHPISYPLKIAMQWVAFAADEVVLVAEHMHRFLKRCDYHVIPGGIDLGLFRPLPQERARLQLGLEPDRLLVAFVGSPTNAVKRHWLAKEAVGNLPKALGVELLTITGVSPEQVPIHLNAADALLVTSKHEGSPNMVKEAMACNLPIVSVKVGDVSERLAKVTGCAVIDSDDPKEIACQLEQVLYRRERTNGWEVAQELDENRLALRQIEVYESAIAKNRRRR